MSGVLVAIIATLSLVAGCSSTEQAVVPDVVEADVHSAYHKLHRAGFAVQIDEPFDVTPSHTPYVRSQSTAGGEKASIGSTVSLELRPGPHGLLPPGPPALRMPRLVGKPLSDAALILTRLGLSWEPIPLPPLPAGTEPHLLHNYEVAHQEPKPGVRFLQTVTREVPEGIATETTPVLLRAALRAK